jgi:oligoribonuclease
VLESKDTAASVEAELLEYIQRYVPKGEGYLAGNSVHFDKEFMKLEFPSVIEYLRHRIIGSKPPVVMAC